HDGTYGISKQAVPIFINDLLSLKKLNTIFYGTPFNLNFEKIRCVNFNRYCAVSNTQHRAHDTTIEIGGGGGGGVGG
ncbi:hypothetical protein ACPTFY_15890, partial [Enterococcus faecalis]